MKNQILIGLILLSSCVKINAQTNVDLLDGQHGSFYGEFNNLTQGNNINYNTVNYNRNSNLIIQPIHLPNYTGQINAPFQDYGMIATIGGLSMFPTQLAFSNEGKIAYRTSYKYSDSYTFDNAWRNIVTVAPSGISLNYLPKFGSNSDLINSVIYDDGNSIGIGTPTPLEKLDVRGNVYINSGIDDNHIYWGGHNMTMGTKPGDYSHNVLSLKPGGADNGPLFSRIDMYFANSKTDHEQRVMINTSGESYFNGGNVGIGTKNFSQKLSVYDSNFGIASFFGGKVSNVYQYSQIYIGQQLGAGYSANIGYMTHQTDQTLSGFYMTNYGDAEGITGVFIKKGGNVGIGTTKPTHLLSVNGSIRAKEVIVDLCSDLADYVFDENYKLMPLHQVEQFVKTNNHLPEVPSAAEVSKNGLSVGEMQNKLLQKIEELTLYVIQQQKQIEKQNEEIAKLKSSK